MKMVKCDLCGALEPLSTSRVTEHGTFCKRCFRVYKFVPCKGCGDPYPMQGMRQLKGSSPPAYACKACQRGIVTCHECGKENFDYLMETIHDLETGTEYELCGDHIERGVTHDECEVCGDWFTMGSLGEDGRRCMRCDDEQQDSASPISGYHDHSRRWHRFGEAADGVYYGVELEAVLSSGTSMSKLNRIARIIRNSYGSIGGREFLFTERDSSLTDDHERLIGFETIFHPMSFEFIKKNEKLLSSYLMAMQKLGMLGFWAQRREASAGMHVTVTWDAFSSQEKTKFLSLIYVNRKLTAMMSRRTHKALEEYAHLTAPTAIWRLVSAEKPSWHVNKHVAVNIKYMSSEEDDDDAVTENKLAEVRIFRSTLKPESFLMNIEYVAACTAFAKDERYSVSDCTAEKLLGMIKEKEGQFGHLDAWLTERGMYQ